MTTSIAIIELLYHISFFTEKDSPSRPMLYHTIERWTLGKENIDLESHLETIKQKSNFASLDEISRLTVVIMNLLSGEYLGLLLYDIEHLLTSSNSITLEEAQLLHIISDAWSKTIISFQQIQIIIANHECKFSNQLQAYALLLSIALRIDGRICRDEIFSLKKNLEVWPNTDARYIFAIMEQFEKQSSKNSILQLFSTGYGISESDSRFCNAAIEYIKNNCRPELQQIMYSQILNIAKADGVIDLHENWLIDKISTSWSI